MDANEQRAHHLAMVEECAFILDRGDAGDKLYAKSIRAVAALVQQVPADGEWVLVPREPTEAMLDALGRAVNASCNRREWYAHLIAATPQAPQPVVDASQPQQGAVEAADAEEEFFARDFYEEAKAGKVPWPCGTYSPTIGQQAVDDAREKALRASLEFVSKFTSGNSVMRDVRAIAVRAGPTIAQEATSLRDQINAALAAHGKGGRDG